MSDESGDIQRHVTNNGSQKANGSDVKTLQEGNDRYINEACFVVISSDSEDSGSSPTPPPSKDDEDPFDSSYSPRSTSSDSRNISLEPTAIDEDLEISNYNASPGEPSTDSESAARSESGTHAYEKAGGSSRAGPGRSQSAVEGLKAIQAELIPGYEDNGGRSE